MKLRLKACEMKCWKHECDIQFFFCFQQGLLLLQHLTKGNAAIQKIVAFENAFERLLDIITEEGSSDGGEKILSTGFLLDM